MFSDANSNILLKLTTANNDLQAREKLPLDRSLISFPAGDPCLKDSRQSTDLPESMSATPSMTSGRKRETESIGSGAFRDEFIKINFDSVKRVT
jgi:hypothetical protein